MKIVCTTLFDITKTNASSRRNRLDSDFSNDSLAKERGQQTNFETLLQVLSMRTQPENITDPEKSMVRLVDGVWGYDYKSKAKVPQWQFSFTVDQISSYSDNITELGGLQRDCIDVPMVTNLEEWHGIIPQLRVDSAMRNIKFEIIQDVQQDNQ
jgi:hypothetical protein